MFGQKLWITGQKLQLVTYEDETNATLTVNHATTVTTGAWHLAVFTLSPFGPYGKARGCISLDGGAFTCGSLAYNMKRNYGDLDVGGAATEVLRGYIDGFGIWSRAWDTSDVAWYWNGGAGRAFPF